MIARCRRLGARLVALANARRRRLAAYLLVVAFGAGGLWRVEATADQARESAALARGTADALRAQVRRANAQACASQWERVPQLRDAIELSVRAGTTEGAGAVFDVAAQLSEEPLPPEASALLDAAVDQRVRRRVSGIVDDYPDPTCDLAAAQEVLAEPGPEG